MLSNALAVTTIAVTDLDRAKEFYGGTLRLIALDETPFSVRYGTTRGSQIAVRRGTPNIGQTVDHFEIDDIERRVSRVPRSIEHEIGQQMRVGTAYRIPSETSHSSQSSSETPSKRRMRHKKQDR